MAKLTLGDLKNLRDQKKKELDRRESVDAKKTIIIGMGTCGIAAGAKETFDAIMDEVVKNDIPGVVVKQTGCMGLCYCEPSVEVICDDAPDAVYSNVDADTGRRIVLDHIMNGKLVEGHLANKPAADILEEGA